MTVPHFNVTIRASGPVFDQRGPQIIRRYGEAAERAVAEEGARMVRQRLHQVLRHPTGYYEGHVAAERFNNRWEVNDDGIVYGPWLEGTGSRNRTTRFKGYATFRRTKALLDQKSRSIAERQLPRYLSELNG